MSEREFKFHNGRFYSPIDSESWGRATQLGVWELATLRPSSGLPEGAVEVTVHPPGPSDRDTPSGEPGKTWGARAVAAEMEAAQMRVELREAQRGRDAAIGSRDGLARQLDRKVRAHVEELAGLRTAVERLAADIAEVWQRDYSPTELVATRHRVDPAADDVDEEAEVNPPTLDEILGWIQDTVRRDLPGSSVALPSKMTRAVAMTAWRAAIGQGLQLGAAMDAALEGAANASGASGEAHRAGRHVAVADASCPTCVRLWAVFVGFTVGDGLGEEFGLRPGTRCPLCNHERADHVSPGGRDCEAGLRDQRRMCGCSGIVPR